MDAAQIHAAEVNVAEIDSAHEAEVSICTLTSAEMSFAGGGLLGVAFM